MVLMHFTSSQWELSTYKVSVEISCSFRVDVFDKKMRTNWQDWVQMIKAVPTCTCSPFVQHSNHILYYFCSMFCITRFQPSYWLLHVLYYTISTLILTAPCFVLHDFNPHTDCSMFCITRLQPSYWLLHVLYNTISTLILTAPCFV